MIIFMSQAPILVAVLLMLLLIALFELIGLKTRYNIAVLAAVALVCLGAAALERNGDPSCPRSSTRSVSHWRCFLRSTHWQRLAEVGNGCGLRVSLSSPSSRWGQS